jgi:uncharacterized membrane protein
MDVVLAAALMSSMREFHAVPIPVSLGLITLLKRTLTVARGYGVL